MRRLVVWGTGNMGSTAIRSALAFPGLQLAGVITTAANRLLGAIDWLATQPAGIYDGLDVPLRSALPTEVEATRWA